MTQYPCIVYECDHLRQLIKIDGKWWHIHDGEPSAPCGASSVYRFEVKRPKNSHTIANYVTHNRA